MLHSSRLCHNGDFIRFWSASGISITGSMLSVIAYPLLVLSLGGSAAQAGAVASAALIARVVCRLPGGHLADLVNQRTLMVVMDLTRLVAVGSIPLAASLGRLGYPQLLAVAIVEGVATAGYLPAAMVLLRTVVAGAQVARALSWMQATGGTVGMVGPLLGGVLFTIGPTLPFVVDAASYAVSAGLLLTVSTREPARAGRDGSSRGVTAGLRWLWRQPGIMRLVMFAGVLNLASAAAEVLVLIGLRQRGSSGATIGIVMACAGLGAVTGAVLAVRILEWLRANTLYLVTGLVWTVGSAALAAVTTPWAIGPLLVGLMVLAPAASIRLGQITLDQAPRHVLGRVSTAQAMVSSGLASAGPGLAGVLLHAAGASAAWVAVGVVCLMGTGAVLLPIARRAESLLVGSEAPVDGS